MIFISLKHSERHCSPVGSYFPRPPPLNYACLHVLIHRNIRLYFNRPVNNKLLKIFHFSCFSLSPKPLWCDNTAFLGCQKGFLLINLYALLTKILFVFTIRLQLDFSVAIIRAAIEISVLKSCLWLCVTFF